MVERGIGRGLAAILPPAAGDEERLVLVPTDQIRPNPRQPRAVLDEETLAGLAESIRAHGILQPLLVRPGADGSYELIAGERRWRAARLAGIDRVPALVRPSEDAERLELALIENLAREDLNPIEAARGCAALVEELGLTQEEVGKRVGRSRVAVSNLIRLLELPDEALALLERGELSEGHGRALLQAPSPVEQRSLAREVRDRGLSVRETEAKARAVAASPSGLRVAERGASDRADAERARQEAEDSLARALGMEVHVRLKRRGCSVEIPFEALSEIYDFARRLSGRIAA